MNIMKYIIIPVTHYQQNSTILWCENTLEAISVDPGGEPDKIAAELDQRGLKLTQVVLTHGHMDHVGAAVEIAKRYSVPINGPHKEDEFWLQMLPDQAKMMGMSDQPPFSPNTWLKEGDRVEFGQESLEVYHCPGHTPGHVVLFHRKSQLALVGDVLFSGSIGRTDFPRGNHEQLLDSIITKLWPLGDATEFVPGHGPMSTFGQERATNPFVADHRYG